MKALTLWQPWATLIAIGAKRIETRSWATSYRGELAIHAAKRWNEELFNIASSEPFRTAIMSNTPECRDGFPLRDDLPLGVIVCTCQLIDVLRMANDGLYSTYYTDKERRFRPYPTGNEREFGLYTPGRFAWILDEIKKLDTPIPARGGQQLWNWEPDQQATPATDALFPEGLS